MTARRASTSVSITATPLWRIRLTRELFRYVLVALSVAGLAASARFAIAPPRPSRVRGIISNAVAAGPSGRRLCVAVRAPLSELDGGGTSGESARARVVRGVRDGTKRWAAASARRRAARGMGRSRAGTRANGRRARLHAGCPDRHSGFAVPDGQCGPRGERRPCRSPATPPSWERRPPVPAQLPRSPARSGRSRAGHGRGTRSAQLPERIGWRVGGRSDERRTRLAPRRRR